jgi:hypothetical protein
MKWIWTVAQYVLLAVIAVAQEKTPAAPVDPTVPKYDVQQETRIAGVVQAVSDYECAVSGTMGAHITVKEGKQIFEVHLAPTKFLHDYDVAFATGDSVLITGVRTEWHGTTAVLAREVEQGVNRYTFRDETGKPLW